ncbi:MAG: hypothetical protein KA354_00560 [Phycisphaerae bacterium]|nr:hypothetical protein [Phycisphaerae bacterium]
MGSCRSILMAWAVVQSPLLLPIVAAELNWTPTIEPAAGFPRLLWSSRTIQDCESPAQWSTIHPAGASITLTATDGMHHSGLRLNYDLSGDNWVIANCRFPQAVNLSSDDFIGLWYRGTPLASEHRLEIKLKDADDEFIVHVPRVAHVPAYVHLYIDHRLFNDQDATVGDGVLDWSDIREILVAISRGDPTDYSQQPPTYSGTFDVDLITSCNSKVRATPAGFERFSGSPDVAAAAAGWIAGRRNATTGLIPSWAGDFGPWAYLYDDALALMVLMHTHPQEAAQLAATLLSLQLPDGSWHRRYDAATKQVVPMDTLDAEFWVGDIAWMTYALARYAQHTASLAYARSALRGAAYLVGRLQDDCRGMSIHWVTEGNIDSWWAFQATAYHAEADQMLAYLLNCVWDPAQRRWIGGRTGGWWNSLDCQNWGSPIHVAIGQQQDALAALGFATEALRTWDFTRTVEAFDGQGPFSVWYEGTAQYVCARGPGAQWLLDHVLNPAQRPDGSMPGTPPLPASLPNQVAWSGDGVWLTTWSGLAPTTWLYFANTDTPLAAGPLVSCRADLDHDADVDATDLTALRTCLTGMAIPPSNTCAAADLDADQDVDLDDFAVLQRCFSGTNALVDSNCAR